VLIRIANYVEDFASIGLVRHTVFVDEQRVPEDLEFDERDPVCVHVLATSAGVLVGTGRIDLEAGGKIGRVAVLAAHRRSGVGTAVMERLHDVARDRGASRVWCNAQISARPFYERLGYRVTSEPFEEAGIMHVRMDRPL
jgi:predicted GNAT family N-acyltransferase